MDFRQTSIVELVRQIRGGDMSAVEVTAAALENIEKVDGQLNSFCSVNTVFCDCKYVVFLRWAGVRTYRSLAFLSVLRIWKMQPDT